MRQQIVGRRLPIFAQLRHGSRMIGRIPKNDGGHDEVEAGGAVTLVFEGAVAQFAETIEKHRPGAADKSLVSGQVKGIAAGGNVGARAGERAPTAEIKAVKLVYSTGAVVLTM